MTGLIYLALSVPAFIIAIAGCLPWFRPTRPVWLFACLGYILADEAVTFASLHLIPGLDWNWVGKAFSVALACLVVAILRPTRTELPLGLPAGRRAWARTFVGMLVATLFTASVGFALRDHTVPTMDKIAYEATMPGLAEELCWRGLVFLFLGRAYRRPDHTLSLVPAAIASTLIFGLLHGINIDRGSTRFVWIPFLFASLFAAWAAILRLRSRSLPALIATHNIANVCSDLVNALP